MKPDKIRNKDDTAKRMSMSAERSRYTKNPKAEPARTEITGNPSD